MAFLFSKEQQRVGRPRSSAPPPPRVLACVFRWLFTDHVAACFCGTQQYGLCFFFEAYTILCLLFLLTGYLSLLCVCLHLVFFCLMRSIYFYACKQIDPQDISACSEDSKVLPLLPIQVGGFVLFNRVFLLFLFCLRALSFFVLAGSQGCAPSPNKPGGSLNPRRADVLPHRGAV